MEIEVHRQETMMEEREELMVAPGGGGGKPTLRRAHFLTPTAKNQSFPFPLSSNAIINPKSMGKKFNVSFPGWRRLTKCVHKEWKRWVHKLMPFHGETWKKAGIFDAILSSTCIILKRKVSKNLMMKLAEKWCPETNTFLFSWGESTVTLEDVMVLGGLPVLGQPAWNPRKSDEMRRLDAKLKDAHADICRNTQQATRESTWMDHFDGVGDEGLEHEAFLVLWLSRYIFPCKYGLISKDLFLIAINLSRGISVALAPSVLASIYRDLGSLRKASLMDCQNGEIFLCSPLGLVQVWVWERFPKLSPAPNPIELGKLRLSRWHEVNPLDFDVRGICEMLDSSGEDFLWRPYARMLTNWDSKKLYNENEMYVMAGSVMDSEVIQVWVRCCRYSELVGIDCMEKYLPHRVGMQFGFDQDIPGPVERIDEPVERRNGRGSAWHHFNRPVGDPKVYLPARLFESDITKRYQKERNRAQRMQEMRNIVDDVSVTSEEGEENGDEDDSEPEIMEIHGYVEDQSGPERIGIPGFVDEHSEPEKMEIQGCVEDHSEPEKMEIQGGVEDHSEPDKMKILGVDDDHSGPERVVIPDKMEIPSSVKNDDVTRVEEKSRSPVEHGLDTMNCKPVSSTRSSSSYSIEEVQAMVSNLEKCWAEVKAKRRGSIAK